MKIWFYNLPVLLLIILCGYIPMWGFSQVTLEADGPGNTYELINGVFAPGNDAIESTECTHPDFGRHIAEVWDDELNRFVFEFYIHVTPDNDRCINFDRQRVEIKTYDKSPENLKGIPGETVTYKWKFRIPTGFKPSSSFTHIHQIKAVGGDDGMPLFTLTPRSGSPDKIELIHNNITKVKTAPLSLFEGVWVEVTEKITIDNLHGSYSITIKKVSDETVLLTYSHINLMTIRSDNTFIRPKWGIYRSLNNSTALRDETMRFAGFSILEGIHVTAPTTFFNEKVSLTVFPIPALNEATFEYDIPEEVEVQLDLYDANGQIVKTILPLELQIKGRHQEKVSVSDLQEGLYFVRLSADNFTKTVQLCIVK
jgi:hypothetical protein